MKGESMFPWNRITERTGLEIARDEALSELCSFTAETKEYKEVVTRIETLTKLIALQKPEKLSVNTLAIILGNIGIALVVVAYESKNVMTTKVLPFLTRTQKNT